MGLPITQSEFEKILDDILLYKKGLHPGAKLPLAAYLKEKGYSSILQNLNFAVPGKTVSTLQMQRTDGSLVSATKLPRRTDLLNNIDFTGCKIKKCQFDECDLSGSIWCDQVIRGSSFNNTVINHASFHGVRFINNHFTQTSFDYSTLNNLLFLGNHFLRTRFNYLKQLCKLTFTDCIMQQASILGGARAVDVIINNSPGASLSHVSELLTDKEIAMHQVKKTNTKPAVLVSWNNVTPLLTATLAEKMLLAQGMYPVRMDVMPEVDAALLDKEINTLNALTQHRLQQLKDDVLAKAKKLATKSPKELSYETQSKSDIAEQCSVKASADDISTIFTAEWKKQGISFPLLMIQIMREENTKKPSAFPQMSTLYSHAKAIFNQVDGVLLTGGQDMDPRIYGEKCHPKTGLPTYTEHPELSDPRRDILEFSLVYMQQRESAPKPLCGICRGSQVIAASYGATIYQELDSPERRQYLVEPIKPKSIKTTTPFFSTGRALASVADKEATNVIFMHHQGYDLGQAFGVETTASTQTSGGKVIDIVGENLQQNITLTQAHIEYYMDQEEGAKGGFAPHVSASTAGSILQQFQTRVLAYCQNQRLLSHVIPNMFFTKNGSVLKERAEHSASISLST